MSKGGANSISLGIESTPPNDDPKSIYFNFFFSQLIFLAKVQRNERQKRNVLFILFLFSPTPFEIETNRSRILYRVQRSTASLRLILSA
jgi:hypothetical protein